MNKKLLSWSLAALFLWGCGAPRLVSTAPKADMPYADSVKIYHYAAPVPPSARTLGSAAVVNSGHSRPYHFLQSIEFAKELAAEAGGNAFLITDYSLPKMRSSMFEIVGDILFVGDTVTPPVQTVTPTIVFMRSENSFKRLLSDPKVKSRLLAPPSNRVSISMGYCGWAGSHFVLPDGRAKSPDGIYANLSYDHTLYGRVMLGGTVTYHTALYYYEDGKYGFGITDLFPKLCYRVREWGRLGLEFNAAGGYSAFDELKGKIYMNNGEETVKTKSVKHYDGWGASIGTDIKFELVERTVVWSLSAAYLFNRYDMSGRTTDIKRYTVGLNMICLF